MNEELGTHSFRKGGTSFLASQPGAPGMVAVFLRAGWSLGPVRDTSLLVMALIKFLADFLPVCHELRKPLPPCLLILLLVNKY